jgi:hypothetical protein
MWDHNIMPKMSLRGVVLKNLRPMQNHALLAPSCQKKSTGWGAPFSNLNLNGQFVIVEIILSLTDK